MKGRRNPFVAGEGIPFVMAAVVAAWALATYWHWVSLLPMLALSAVLWLVFRDPRRRIPAAPLGVVSPVDGEIVKIDMTDRGVSQGEAQRIVIRVDMLGTYTARSPVEGMIRDLNSLARENVVDYKTHALWLQTDEGENVVLQFDGYRLGIAPRSLLRYGERVGQGQRCAYLRLTKFAELHLPLESQILAKEGDIVEAGTKLIANLPHP